MSKLHENAPSAAATALGADAKGSGADESRSHYHSPQPRRKRLVAKAIGPDGRPFTETGQVGKVLRALIEAGETGITPLARETWSLRLSDHVRKLKNRRGLAIVTLWGKHEDGRHARYVLRSTVTIIEVISH